MDEHHQRSWKRWLLGILEGAILLAVGGLAWFAFQLSATDAQQTTKIQAIEQRLDRMPPEGSDALAAQRFEDVNRRLAGIETDVREIKNKLDRWLFERQLHKEVGSCEERHGNGGRSTSITGGGCWSPPGRTEPPVAKPSGNCCDPNKSNANPPPAPRVAGTEWPGR